MKKKLKLNKLGLSLIECMIVIVIISVMLLIWRFTSSGHIKLAIIDEGHMFVEKVISQEKIYRANTFDFERFGSTKKNEKLGISTYDNKYFLTFSADTAGEGGALRVFAYGSGKASGVTIAGTYVSGATSNEIVINEYGLQGL